MPGHGPDTARTAKNGARTARTARTLTSDRGGVICVFSKASVGAEDDWNLTLSDLSGLNLIALNTEGHPSAVTVDAHPLIREFFSKRVQRSEHSAWTEANRRIAEYFLSGVSQDTPAAENRRSQQDFELLFRAAAHTCMAGNHSLALHELYRRRISGGDVGYATRNYGLFTSELSLLAAFFERPWERIVPGLNSEADRLLILRCTGFSLAALGRQSEGLPLLRNALAIAKTLPGSYEAAIIARNLANFLISAGEVADAESILKENLHHADLSTDKFMPVGFRCSLAYARCLENGPLESVASLFDEAWRWNSRRGSEDSTPELPTFQYCEFLIARGEGRDVLKRLDELETSTASKLTVFGVALFGLARIKACIATGDSDSAEKLLGSGQDAIRRAGRRDLIARWHLAQVELTFQRLGEEPINEQFIDLVRTSLDEAGEIAERDGLVLLRLEHLRLRAGLRLRQNDLTDARADLDEARQIAERGPMRLHLADIHLHRARLFRDKQELKRARALIEQCGYWRRREELEAAEEEAKSWPDISTKD